MKDLGILFHTSMLLALIAPSVACNTSVSVGNVSRATTLRDTTTTSTIPGLPDAKFPTPVDLSSGECPFEGGPRIVAWGADPNIDPNTAGKQAPPPNMGIASTEPGKMILYWTLCNDGGVAQGSGTTYQFSVNIQQIDSGLPPGSRTKSLPTAPPTQVTLPVPPLPSCSCFVQEVGINTAVPPEAHQQENIGNFGGADVSFPTVTLPGSQAPTPDPSGRGKLTFQYDAGLSQFGVGHGFFQLP